ncbi:MAG: Signal recognition particle protein [Gammaproteobacteria bacterium]|jgi:signal recognition particle subunit SRP54|nr:Signal recognition particle protein [Gammaproteobacteria bacterium]
MFQQLSERLGQTLKSIRGQGRLSEDNIKKALKDVRQSLLEADVAVDVVQEFTAKVKRRALGREVAKSLNPGQVFIKIVKAELTELMGEKCEELNLAAQPPAVILMAGLQGSGKTTSSAKLARWLKEQRKKKVLLVSTDVYRPAAMQQLETLAKELEVECFPAEPSQKPVDIAKRALEVAKKQAYDVLIVDTAGRLHIDSEMMGEIKSLHQSVNPVETLFVVDSMTGQDAANTAKAFHDVLPLTGVILTKADGDARGGAALSIRQITGKPIKFLGVGEKTDALEAFHPDRMASRILGMGDVLGLIEGIEQKVDREKSQELAKKVMSGKGFSLEDFAEQLKQMSNMGSISSLLDKMPGMGNIPEAARNKINDKMFVRMTAIISSMTKKERRNPDLINGSRKRRIALGSGVEVQEVNKLLKQFDQMQKVMKKMGKGGFGKMLRGMGGMAGMKNMMPPGFQ